MDTKTKKHSKSPSSQEPKGIYIKIPDIMLGELRKEAEEDCRTLEQQIIYVLKNRLPKCKHLCAGWYTQQVVRSDDGNSSGISSNSSGISSGNGSGFPINWDGSPKVTC